MEPALKRCQLAVSQAVASGDLTTWKLLLSLVTDVLSVEQLDAMEKTPLGGQARSVFFDNGVAFSF